MTAMESTLQQIHAIMNQENAVLVYSGEFNQDIVKSMLSYAEGKLDATGVDDLVKKKMFNVMVEMLQNITKHQFTTDEEQVVQPCFVLIEEDEYFNVVTGNPIHVDKIDIVSERINTVNGMNADQLKEYYKQARLNSRISDVGGAGLGFIDMARKSENKLDFGVYDIDSEDYKYFSLKARINKVLA
jgi:hypothetical protein